MGSAWLTKRSLFNFYGTCKKRHPDQNAMLVEAPEMVQAHPQQSGTAGVQKTDRKEFTMTTRSTPRPRHFPPCSAPCAFCAGGPPGPDFVPWRPSPEEIARIKAAGRITPAGRWDCANYDERVAMHPQLNPNKRWYEQKAWKLVK